MAPRNLADVIADPDAFTLEDLDPAAVGKLFAIIHRQLEFIGDTRPDGTPRSKAEIKSELWAWLRHHAGKGSLH